MITENRLNEIIKEVVSKIRPVAEKEKVKINKIVNQPNSSSHILGDKDTLKNLFTIILDNAIKYNKKNSFITVAIDEIKNHVQVKISDQGIGISKFDLPHVFDRFYRADKARSSDDHSGYGLGLSIAKEITEAHKGKIAIESEEGKGTTVSVTFPKYFS